MQAFDKGLKSRPSKGNERNTWEVSEAILCARAHRVGGGQSNQLCMSFDAAVNYNCTIAIRPPSILKCTHMGGHKSSSELTESAIISLTLQHMVVAVFVNPDKLVNAKWQCGIPIACTSPATCWKAKREYLTSHS